jgi:hypothetical protein
MERGLQPCAFELEVFMPSQSKIRRPDSDEPTGISAAAIEGAEQAAPGRNADKLAQPGPGLSDTRAEGNYSEMKRNPDVEKFHDGGAARTPDADDEWEVLDN